MKIKVTSTIILDTDKIDKARATKVSIEREALNPGSERLGRLWAWDEANKQNTPDITLRIIH